MLFYLGPIEGVDKQFSRGYDLVKKIIFQALELNGEAPEGGKDTTDYVALLKKLIDPNIGDMEMKPTLKLLMEGTYIHVLILK